MILKKPYAFIIKHFRAIHLALLLPMFYLISETKDIVNFFVDYIANGYIVSSDIVLSNIASNYINIFMYLAIVIILAVLLALSILLQNKDKPTKFYNISIVYYIFLFIIITASFSIFKMIETDTLDTVFARIIRDIAFIVHYSQYIFLIFTFIRGIGFNIKKFNFKSDIQDLEISSEDSEEFEFLVGIDTYKTKRTVRRFFRELKYYYKENKFIFTIIFLIALIALGTIIYMNREVYQRVYKEQEIISFGYLTFNIKDTYISSLSLNGETINDGKAYLIMQIQLNNRYREDREFNYSDLALVINKRYISPNISMGSYFKDFGNPYNGSSIKGNTNNTYVLVYELDKNLVNNTYTIEAYSSYDSSPGGLGLLTKKITLRPTILNNNIISNKINKGTNLSLNNTNLLNTSASILSYELTNRHEYKYEYCYNADSCYEYTDAITVSFDNNGSTKTLLVMDYSLNLDSESTYMYSNKNYQTFFEDFMKIKYTLNGKETYINTKLKNTPNYDKRLVMEVPKEIEHAESIEAIITVRNVSYIIKLK